MNITTTWPTVDELPRDEHGLIIIPPNYPFWNEANERNRERIGTLLSAQGSSADLELHNSNASAHADIRSELAKKANTGAAPAAHSHKASEITGPLLINQGGTGAATAAAALTALGAYSKAEVDAALANKASKGTPQIYNIPFLTGFKKVDGHAATFAKTENNIVIVNLSIAHESRSIAAGLHSVAVLPEGFRPAEHVIVCPSALYAFNATYVGFYNDGIIRLRVLEAIPRTYTAVAFLAAK